MENRPIKILLIEDIPEDILRFRLMLADVKGVKFDITALTSSRQGMEALGKTDFEAIFLNLLLKDNTGMESLLRIQERAPQTPIILLTAKEDQAMAFDAVQKGAQDYLVKGKLDGNLLYRVIHYAMERQRSMEEMKRKNEELERLSSLKSEFVSTVSHELRTPLTVILSASNNLLDGAFGALGPNQAKWVGKISHHATKLHKMISDILDLSRLQSGKAEFKEERVNLEKLIKATVTNLKILAKEKKINLTFLGADNPLPVCGDAGRLEQVVTNLITNAIKFTPNEGTIKVSGEEKGGWVVVAVADTGPGIEAHYHQLIFDRFRQIRSVGEPSSTKGIGLGLAICKEILTQHQGDIWVESEPGHGAKFIFKIPFDSGEAAKPALHVLVVDDDEAVCALLESILLSAGHTVVTAKNGKQAIQYLRDKKSAFDVAFLDLMLPGANGVEVIKEIAALKAKTEVVIITAYPNSQLLFEGMAYGPLTILAKPFDPEKIAEVARRTLSLKSSPQKKKAA